MKITDIYLSGGRLLELELSSLGETDALDVLTEIELKVWSGFQHEKRKREFLATRILRNTLFGKATLTYDVHGAPQAPDGGYLSISHTAKVAALLFHPNYKIGLDLEEISDKAQRVAQKFLHPIELKQFDGTSAMEMTACWSAKETLYKLAGRTGIDFKNELRLERVTDTLYIGSIFQGDFWEVCKITIFEKDKRIYSFNSTLLEKK